MEISEDIHNAIVWIKRLITMSSPSVLQMSTSQHSVVCESGLAAPSQPARLEGYPSFAQFIATDSDAAIYRKYGNLSARNLLYLQSELHELEEQLQQLDMEDAKDISNEAAQRVAREWGHYNDPDNQAACRHKVLQEKIRLKVREYRTYMVVQASLRVC